MEFSFSKTGGGGSEIKAGKNRGEREIIKKRGKKRKNMIFKKTKNAFKVV